MNSRWKWLVDDLERGQQPLARLAVEALDALAQPLDGFDQVVALGGERGVLGLDLAQFFLGAQVDGAEPLAVAAQLFEVFLDLGERRQLGARLDLGERRHGVRLDLEHVVDFVRDVGEPALGAFERSSARAAGFARRSTALRARSSPRGRSRAIAFSAAASASAATRRAVSAASISLISARRFSANSAGALSSSARSAVTSVMRASRVAICEAALCLAVLPLGALGR